MKIEIKAHNIQFIEKLVDIKGENVEGVVNYILTAYIGTHREELKAYGITLERANGKITIGKKKNGEIGFTQKSDKPKEEEKK